MLFVLAVCTPAQDRRVVTELDPGLNVALDLDSRLRLDIYTGRERSEELSTSKQKVGGGISYRLKSEIPTFLDALDQDKHHVLVIGAFYEFSKAREAEATTYEHKVWLELTARYGFKGTLLGSDRSRFEFRWINGDYHWRFRNRLMLERPFEVKKQKFLSPYLAAEAFWDQRYNKWNIFKFTTGIQIPFIRRSSFDLYYERQYCVTCSDPKTNIFGLAFNLYLRRIT